MFAYQNRHRHFAGRSRQAPNEPCRHRQSIPADPGATTAASHRRHSQSVHLRVKSYRTTAGRSPLIGRRRPLRRQCLPCRRCRQGRVCDVDDLEAGNAVPVKDMGHQGEDRLRNTASPGALRLVHNRAGSRYLGLLRFDRSPSTSQRPTRRYRRASRIGSIYPDSLVVTNYNWYAAGDGNEFCRLAGKRC